MATQVSFKKSPVAGNYISKNGTLFEFVDGIFTTDNQKHISEMREVIADGMDCYEELAEVVQTAPKEIQVAVAKGMANTATVASVAKK